MHITITEDEYKELIRAKRERERLIANLDAWYLAIKGIYDIDNKSFGYFETYKVMEKLEELLK